MLKEDENVQNSDTYGHRTEIQAKFPQFQYPRALMKKILVLHGPNLNLLGQREPSMYGSCSLIELNKQLQQEAALHDADLTSLQSNSEAELIDTIHSAPKNGINAILFNPAAFTHTSIALRDALLAINIPFYEIHISNIYAREPFRHHSHFSDIASGVISGFGTYGYCLALNAILKQPK